MKTLVLLFTLFLSSLLFAEQAGTINNISLKPESNRFHIYISGDGKLDCNTLSMENPPRIALDFPNVKNKLYPNIIDAEENPYVQRVRTSIYAKGRDSVSRVTVDLKNRFDYTVYRTSAGIVLVVSEDGKKPDPPKESPPKQTAAKGNTQTTGQNRASASNSPVSTQQPQPSTTQAVQPTANIPVTQAQNPSMNMDVVIGLEDLLEVSVFELPQFNTTARVQGDGTITMPLVGSIEVRGLKKQEVEAKIVQALQAKYVNNANVSVNVKEYKSRQVSILGEVRAPGAYYIMSQRTLIQLLSEAGGLSPNAGKKCYIFRPGAAKIEIDLRELMVNGNHQLNITIYPGDVINVPLDQKIIIYVFGAVRSPGAIELSSSMPITLMAAIARAGGPLETAKESDIKIRRKNTLGEENMIKANLKDILKGKVEDIPLYEGDVVTVPESIF